MVSVHEWVVSEVVIVVVIEGSVTVSGGQCVVFELSMMVSEWFADGQLMVSECSVGGQPGGDLHSISAHSHIITSN